MNDSKADVEDLAAWLTQIWDEQERIYKYAPDFVEDSGSARGPGWGTAGGDTCEVCGAYQFSGLENIVEDAWYEHMEQVHQRTEVLARIAADRKILALHSYHMVSSLDSRLQPIPGSRRPHCDTCASQDENGEWWPCETVRLMAEPYADRPGFRPEWLVERQGVEQ